MISYLFQSLSYWAVCYLFYYLVLRHDTFFSFNRWYLLLTPLLCLGLPFLSNAWFVPENFALTQAVLLPEVLMSSAANQSSVTSVSNSFSDDWIYNVWIAGALFMAAKILWELVSLWRITRAMPRERKNGYTVLYTNGVLPNGSFGRYLFWNDKTSYTAAEADAIFRHELAHISQLHTADILLMKILSIVLWFNPLVYIFLRELRVQHEFIADAEVLRKSDNVQQYSALVAKSYLQSFNLSVTHSFNQSFIQKRLLMMKKSNAPFGFRWKYLAIIPSLATLLVFFAAQENALAQSSAKMQAEAQSGTPAQPVGGMETLMKSLGENLKYPESAQAAKVQGKVFLSFIVSEKGEMKDIKVVKSLNKECDEAAMAALKNAKIQWIPATEKSGKKVKQQMTLPVMFAL
jgi:TonB family protein